MIRAENVRISYVGSSSIAYPDFSIEERAHTGFFGQNASGKSTLAHGLAGLIPDFIPATIEGHLITHPNTSLLLQNPSSQFFATSVQEELGSVNPSDYQIEHLWNRSVFELSDGEKQKINLISMIESEVDTIVCDEPLELLDPIQSSFFSELLCAQDTKTMLWFDKDEKKIPLQQIVRLSQTQAIQTEKPVFAPIGKQVLAADFSIEKKDFRLSCDFRLHESEKVALIGNNGSGKTTLLKALSLSEPTRGKVKSDLPLSYCPQNPSLLLYEQTLQKHTSNHELIEQFGLASKRLTHPQRLSKAQQKLAAIATLPQNGILLLDEPTAWLDASNKNRFYSFVEKSRQPMVLATHDSELLDYCHQIYLVSNKEVIPCSHTTAKRFFRGHHTD